MGNTPTDRPEQVLASDQAGASLPRAAPLVDSVEPARPTEANSTASSSTTAAGVAQRPLAAPSAARSDPPSLSALIASAWHALPPEERERYAALEREQRAAEVEASESRSGSERRRLHFPPRPLRARDAAEQPDGQHRAAGRMAEDQEAYVLAPVQQAASDGTGESQAAATADPVHADRIEEDEACATGQEGQRR